MGIGTEDNTVNGIHMVYQAGKPFPLSTAKSLCLLFACGDTQLSLAKNGQSYLMSAREHALFV